MIAQNKIMAHTGLKTALFLVSAVSLAACGTHRTEPQAISATKPSITYSYTDDQGLVEATRKAETYCVTYNAWPRTADIYNKPEGGRNVSFVCDQPRTASVAPGVASSSVGVPVTSAPPQPYVNYTYRDDRGLVEATSMAARYCAGFNAQARSTLVQNNVDGSKTMSFECVRTM
jgi:hypothetical protein